MTPEQPERESDPLTTRVQQLTLDLARLRGFLTTEHREPPRHKKPKLRVIKGGLAAFLGPFVVAGERLRDHLAVTTATAATAATVFAAPVLLTEPPTPAVAEPQISYLTNPSPSPTVAASSVRAPLFPPVVPGLVSPTAPPTPQAVQGTPGSPAPTSFQLTLMDESGAGESPAVLPPLPELLPTLEPTPEPTPVPTVIPSPEPTPTPTPALSRSEAVSHCLGVLGVPPVGLAGCVEDSLD